MRNPVIQKIRRTFLNRSVWLIAQIGMCGGYVVAILVAACVAMFACPLTAVAGCGDYLHQASPKEWLPSDQTADTSRMSTHERSIPSPQRPCHGPQCSRQTPEPISPSPSLTIPVRDQWALPTILANDLPTNLSRFFCEPPLVLSEGAISAIERPPRG